MALSLQFQDLGMRLRYVTWLVLSVLLAGCGKKSHDRLPWPATYSLSGIADSDSTVVRDAISQLNDKGGKTILTDTSDSSKYPITIQIVDFAGADAGKAGMATISEEKCLVQLSRPLFTDTGMKPYVVPVIWHELGHCAGLLHNPNPGEIMFASTVPYKNYTADEITAFFNDLLKSSHL